MSAISSYPSQPKVPLSLRSLRTTSPVLTAMSMIFICFFVFVMALTFVDPRMINGVNVWDKPAKFLLSLGVHGLTLAFGISLLPVATQQAIGIRRASYVFAFSSIAEMFWISYKAYLGQPSHFNNSDAFHAIMYSLMGVGAVSLTIVTIYLGWKIVKTGSTIVTYATGTGFVLSGILTTIVAGYMSSTTGHSVGGDTSDASGLAFFYWSTTGGDLRVPHFAALHIAQALPLAVWLMPYRRFVNFALLAAAVLVALLFWQALMGIPFISV